MRTIRITLLASMTVIIFSLHSYSQCGGKSCCGKSESQFTSLQPPDYKMIELKVSGIVSKKNASKIHSSLSKTKGVISSQAESETGKVIVTYNPRLISEDHVVSVIENLHNGSYQVSEVLPVSITNPQSRGGCCGSSKSGCTQ